VLGFLGISGELDGNWSVEDEQFLLSLSSQMSHLILTHELSQDLLISKEWDSFNRVPRLYFMILKTLLQYKA
jgi:hypothetical protein